METMIWRRIYKRTNCISFLLVIVLWSTMVALGNSQHFSYIQYSTADGLPTNYVYGAIEDKEGYIWVYTERGIAKFDGYSFKTYNFQDGLSDEDVFLMVKDSFNTLWLCGMLDEPTYIDGNSICTVTLSNNRKFAQSEIESNVILWNTKDSVFVLNENSIVESDSLSVKFREYTDLIDTKSQISLSINHYYGLSHSGKELFEFKDSRIQKQPFKGSDQNRITISGFIQMRDTILYFPFKDQICFYNTKSKSQVNIYWKDLGLDTPLHITGFQAGKNFYLNSEKFVLCIDSSLNIVEKLEFKNISDRFTIMRFFVDSNDNFWIGTREGGLFLIGNNTRNSSIINKPNSKDIVFERILKVDSAIYVLTDRAGMYEVVGDGLVELVKPIGRNSNDIIKLDEENILCAGDRSFVYNTKDGTTAECMESGKACFTNFNTKIEFSKLLLLSTDRDTLFYSDHNRLSLLLLNKEEDNNEFIGLGRIASMSADTMKRGYYFASKNSVLQFTNGELVEVLKLEDNITSITASGDGFLWIGTYASGLFKYNLETKHLQLTAQLNRVMKVILDNDYLYISCELGIVVGALDTVGLEWKYTFNKKDGFSPSIINDFLIHEEYIFCATSEGLFKVSKSNTSTSSNLNDNFLISMLVNETRYEQDDNVKLRRIQNDVRFDYHFNHYESNGKIQYKYKLEPLDNEWKSTFSRSVTYNNLGPNTYSFHLRAVDSFGVEHELTKIFNFALLPGLFETLWFQLLCILLVSSFVIFASVRKNRIHRLRIIREKEQVVKLANLKLDSLRSQMNPHFIFNSLGSILYYIQSNKVDEADDYLSKFARLMRRYLDSSSEKLVLLSEEIALIQDYIYLEKMRFEFSFNSDLHIDEDLNIQSIYLPGMIIQPYIENAILHGLQGRKDGSALLSIRFKNINRSYFACEIEDNGVGLGNSKSVSSHKSRAMDNIYNRLQVLKSADVCNIEIHTDAVKENSQFPGTKVFIKIQKQRIDD